MVLPHRVSGMHEERRDSTGSGNLHRMLEPKYDEEGVPVGR